MTTTLTGKQESEQSEAVEETLEYLPLDPESDFRPVFGPNGNHLNSESWAARTKQPCCFEPARLRLTQTFTSKGQPDSILIEADLDIDKLSTQELKTKCLKLLHLSEQIVQEHLVNQSTLPLRFASADSQPSKSSEHRGQNKSKVELSDGRPIAWKSENKNLSYVTD